MNLRATAIPERAHALQGGIAMSEARTVLENDDLSLQFLDRSLRALNRRSGSVTEFALPGFALVVDGQELGPEGMDWEAPVAEPGRVALHGRCAESNSEAEVIYTLAPDEPWFRKQVILRAPGPAPTPDRLLVHVQPDPPTPIRRVGYGLRGGPDAEEQEGLDTYAPQPGCGYPVWAGDWFMGVEHPAAFTVPRERLELYHHPVWDEDNVIASFPAVFGVAQHHRYVAEAFMDYLWRIRNPRLERPFITFTSGWSTRAIGGGEYIASYEGNQAFFEALLDLGLRPDAMAIDAGYFERRSLFRHKDDDDEDTLFIKFARQVQERGLELSVWVSHNGRTGMDMDWIRAQGWETGDGPGTYTNGEYVVMMQPSFEEALAERFCQIVGRVGARHLKIDWDNECATNGRFADRYPTTDHVREASLLAFNRIDARIRATNPEVITRNGWWPSPWWLQGADHVWLATSGDAEYAVLPSRTQRDRDNTHRDACYYQITVRSETPCPLDAFDNHGFAHAFDNPASEQPNTWLDNAVLQFTRGTTYLHMPICPESLSEQEARVLQQVIDWLHFHAAELGTRGARMIGGNPADGEIYGYLHPFATGGAWLVLRNPSPQPQVFGGGQRLAYDLGWAPRTWRQVYPYWHDLPLLEGILMLGHEVRLIRLEREPRREVSPVPGSPFMAEAVEGGFEYRFPGFAPLTDEIGPTVHESMVIPEITVEATHDEAIKGGRRRMWYCGIPHRLEQAELYVMLRGAEEDLDALTVRAGSSRYRGVPMRHVIPALRIFRKEERGHGTRYFMPPVGPRERDDYVFAIPDGGWYSLTLELLGESANRVGVYAWITGWESPARQTIVQAQPPADGPLLPPHPYGFSRCMRL